VVVAVVVVVDNLVVDNLVVDNLPQAEPLVVDKLHLLLQLAPELQLVQAKQVQLLQLKPQLTLVKVDTELTPMVT
jgi:hypothetical protein